MNTELYASREEWLVARRGFIGASEAPILAGVRPFSGKGPLSVYAEKVAGPGGDGSSVRFEVGRWSEGWVLGALNRWWAEALGGRAVRTCAEGHELVVRGAVEWHACTPDGWVDVSEFGPWGLEIKTADWATGKTLPNPGWGNVMDVDGDASLWPQGFDGADHHDKKVLYWLCQCQWSMHCTGATAWYLAVAVAWDDVRVFRIHRDQGDIDAMVQAVDVFWTQHVCRQEPPDDDEGFEDAWPRIVGEPAGTIALDKDVDWQAVEATYTMMRDAEADAEGGKRTAVRMFKRALGSAMVGRYGADREVYLDSRGTLRFRKQKGA